MAFFQIAISVSFFSFLPGSLHATSIFFLPLLKNIHIGGNTPVKYGNNGDVFSDGVEILVDLVLVFGLIFGLEIAVRFYSMHCDDHMMELTRLEWS